MTSNTCGCTARGGLYCGSASCCAPQISNCCYRTAIPQAYETVYFDVSFEGNLSDKTTVDLTPRPNAHTFRLATDVLPAGWLYDAVKRILYYPMNYRPSGRFAVWLAPTGPNSNGGYTWTVTQVPSPPIETLDCGERTDAAIAESGQYYCLTAQILTTMTAALNDLRTVFGPGVQAIFNGGTTDPSTFQVALASVPVSWAGSLNVTAATWANNRCPSLSPIFDICRAMATVEPDFPARVGSLLTVWSPAGCYSLPFDLTALEDLLTPLASLNAVCDNLPLSVRALTPSGYQRIGSRLHHRTVNANATLIPATDQIVYIDAIGGNITITLAAPAACDPTEFIFVRLDSSGNIVTLTFSSGIEVGTNLNLGANSHVTLHYRNPEFRVIRS